MKKTIQFFIFIGIAIFSVYAFAQDGTEFPPLPTTILTILGTLAPILIQVITKHVSGERARFITAMGLSVVTGLVSLLITGYKISANPELIALWYAWTSAAYKLIWKPIWKKSSTNDLYAEPTQ